MSVCQAELVSETQVARTASAQAQAAEAEVESLKQRETRAAHAKSALARAMADRNSYRRKLDSLQKDTRKLIASKLQIERGLQELRESRQQAAQLATAEVGRSVGGRLDWLDSCWLACSAFVRFEWGSWSWMSLRCCLLFSVNPNRNKQSCL